MKLLVISVFPPVKSPEADHAYHLCRYLAKSGMDVHVLTGSESAECSNSDMTLHPIMQNWSWLEAFRLAKCVRASSPDAILLYYIGYAYNFHPMITFAASICKRLLPETRFVTQFGNVAGVLTQKPWLRFIRKLTVLLAGIKNTYFGTLLRDSDRIIVLSKRHETAFSTFQADVSRKCVLIPPAPILPISEECGGETRERGRKMLGVGSDEFSLAYFGYMYPGKGVETLLQAFANVYRNRKNISLTLIGGITMDTSLDGVSYSQYLHDMARQLGIEERLYWTGEYAWNSDIASVYLRAADICVLPFDTGVALNNSSFATAAVHKLPVVTTRGEQLEAAFVDGKNVLLCPPKDADAMTVKIETLLCDSEMRTRLSAESGKLAEEWFSWEHVVEKMQIALS